MSIQSRAHVLHRAEDEATERSWSTSDLIDRDRDSPRGFIVLCICRPPTAGALVGGTFPWTVGAGRTRTCIHHITAKAVCRAHCEAIKEIAPIRDRIVRAGVWNVGIQVCKCVKAGAHDVGAQERPIQGCVLSSHPHGSPWTPNAHERLSAKGATALIQRSTVRSNAHLQCEPCGQPAAEVLRSAKAET